MKAIAIFEVKVHKTTDKKRLISGSSKKYEYGAINIRSPELLGYVGKKVKARIESV